MKTAIHSITLVACFVTHASAGLDRPLAGMRRAIQTFSAVQAPAPETSGFVLDALPG
jgi:hypothetical protein